MKSSQISFSQCDNVVDTQLETDLSVYLRKVFNKWQHIWTLGSSFPLHKTKWWMVCEFQKQNLSNKSSKTCELKYQELLVIPPLQVYIYMGEDWATLLKCISLLFQCPSYFPIYMPCIHKIHCDFPLEV